MVAVLFCKHEVEVGYAAKDLEKEKYLFCLCLNVAHNH
jgi:hypothetical protein